MSARRPSYSPDDVVCDVCFLTCREGSRYSPCGHNFCRTCVRRHLGGEEGNGFVDHDQEQPQKETENTHNEKEHPDLREQRTKVNSHEQERQSNGNHESVTQEPQEINISRKYDDTQEENEAPPKWCPICKVESTMFSSNGTKKKIRVFKMSCQVCNIQPWTQRCGHCMQNVCDVCKQKHVEAENDRMEMLAQIRDIRQGVQEMQRMCLGGSELAAGAAASSSSHEADPFMWGLYKKYDHLMRAIDRIDKQVL